MTVEDFRRTAVSFEGVEEGSHMGSVDFRRGRPDFCDAGLGGPGLWELMLTPEQQAVFVGEQPEVFLPVTGGWGQMGMTHIRLAAANEDLTAGASRTAWKLRVEKNKKAGGKKRVRF